MAALRSVGLVDADRAFDDEPTLKMHRLTQDLLRTETDNRGDSPAVIDALIPFLYEQLSDEGMRALSPADADLRFRKYFPHLVQAIPALNGPDFRGSTHRDLLDEVAKLIVKALKTRHEVSGDGGAHDPLIETLPETLGCFYEIDPLAEPLAFLLGRFVGEEHAWATFRDECLRRGNYVLRFALAEALADAITTYNTPPFTPEAATELVRYAAQGRTFDHFELGGYALKHLYSADERAFEIDSDLLRLLATHPCYPGRSILGDLSLNLVYRDADLESLLPRADPAFEAFWTPLWDFVRYDVDAVRAAQYLKRNQAPNEAESKAVKDEYAYLRSLDEQRQYLAGTLQDHPTLAGVVQDYFKLGADTKRIKNERPAFEKLARQARLEPVLQLFFGHPLWSVAEAAASVVADLVRDAGGARSADRAMYVAVIERLARPKLPWRVCYGALEAAFQIRLDETPPMKTFSRGVKEFYRHKSSKIRGLCAENLLAVMLNASDAQRKRYEREFAKPIRFWLRDEDCWVLEHVYRYFHVLEGMGRFAGAPHSRLYKGMTSWWRKDREEVLKHIERRKGELTRPARG